jgi:hypothetical protein
LCGQRAAVRLDPALARAVRRDQRAGPQANRFGPQVRVGQFQHDAAHVLIGEVIVPPKSEPVRRTWIPTASLVISRGSPQFVRRTRNDFLIVTAAE